jgi:hypothetical protein
VHVPESAQKFDVRITAETMPPPMLRTLFQKYIGSESPMYVVVSLLAPV